MYLKIEHFKGDIQMIEVVDFQLDYGQKIVHYTIKGAPEMSSVLIPPDARLWVMNDAGKTIDRYENLSAD